MVNYKKFIVIFMIFSIHMMPFNAAYAAGFGAWSIRNQVAQGASTVLTATKQVVLNGANKVATGTAIIKPNVSQVSKVLARGVAGYALSIAIEQLLGKVDWVLDPANNQIIYTKPIEPTKDPSLKFLYSATYNVTASPKLGSPNAVCSYLTADPVFKDGKTFTGTYSVKTRSTEPNGMILYSCLFPIKNGGVYEVIINTIANPIYNPNAEPSNEPKTLPLDTVAARVISNAEVGDAGAQEATKAAAADIISEAEKDSAKARPIINQFENTQSIPTDQTAKGDAVPKENANTENPGSSVAAPETDLTLEFPIFCDWAPSVCQAAKEVINLPITLTDWWDTSTKAITDSWSWLKEQYNTVTTSVTEFFKEQPSQNNEFEFNDPTQITNTSISFSNQCPAPITLADFNYHGTSQKWEMNFLPWCDVLSTFVKPIVIAMASLSAILIVSGVRENG